MTFLEIIKYLKLLFIPHLKDYLRALKYSYHREVFLYASVDIFVLIGKINKAPAPV